MVTRKNVGYRQDLEPCAEDATEAQRKVLGPLHAAELVLAVLGDGPSRVFLWTQQCGDYVRRKLEWDTDDVRHLLIEATTRGRFIGSEWCSQQPKGPVAACDAYSIICEEWNQFAKRTLRSEYYVKFAVSKNGLNILVASCHLSQ